MTRLFALLPLGLFAAGCASAPDVPTPVSEAHGATLRLTSTKKVEATIFKAEFELKNGASKGLAYEHWMTQGPEPVPYCRDGKGSIRICALRVFVMGDDPFVHEIYLQSGESVKFQAVPSRDEHVGVKLWIDGNEEFFWFEHWSPVRR